MAKMAKKIEFFHKVGEDLLCNFYILIALFWQNEYTVHR